MSVEISGLTESTLTGASEVPFRKNSTTYKTTIDAIATYVTDNMDDTQIVSDVINGLATVASSGDYTDLINKPDVITSSEMDAMYDTQTLYYTGRNTAKLYGDTIHKITISPNTGGTNSQILYDTEIDGYGYRRNEHSVACPYTALNGIDDPDIACNVPIQGTAFGGYFIGSGKNYYYPPKSAINDVHDSSYVQSNYDYAAADYYATGNKSTPNLFTKTESSFGTYNTSKFGQMSLGLLHRFPVTDDATYTITFDYEAFQSAYGATALSQFVSSSRLSVFTYGPTQNGKYPVFNGIEEVAMTYNAEDISSNTTNISSYQTNTNTKKAIGMSYYDDASSYSEEIEKYHVEILQFETVHLSHETSVQVSMLWPNKARYLHAYIDTTYDGPWRPFLKITGTRNNNPLYRIASWTYEHTNLISCNGWPSSSCDGFFARPYDANVVETNYMYDMINGNGISNYNNFANLLGKFTSPAQAVSDGVHKGLTFEVVREYYDEDSIEFRAKNYGRPLYIKVTGTPLASDVCSGYNRHLSIPGGIKFSIGAKWEWISGHENHPNATLSIMNRHRWDKYGDNYSEPSNGGTHFNQLFARSGEWINDVAYQDTSIAEYGTGIVHPYFGDSNIVFGFHDMTPNQDIGEIRIYPCFKRAEDDWCYEFGGHKWGCLIDNSVGGNYSMVWNDSSTNPYWELQRDNLPFNMNSLGTSYRTESFNANPYLASTFDMNLNHELSTIGTHITWNSTAADITYQYHRVSKPPAVNVPVKQLNNRFTNTITYTKGSEPTGSDGYDTYMDYGAYGVSINQLRAKDLFTKIKFNTTTDFEHDRTGSYTGALICGISLPSTTIPAGYEYDNIRKIGSDFNPLYGGEGTTTRAIIDNLNDEHYGGLDTYSGRVYQFARNFELPINNSIDISYYHSGAKQTKVATTGSYADLENKPTLTTVASTGSYNDLTDVPEIPTVSTDGIYQSTYNADSSLVTKHEQTTKVTLIGNDETPIIPLVENNSISSGAVAISSQYDLSLALEPSTEYTFEGVFTGESVLVANTNVFESKTVALRPGKQTFKLKTAAIITSGETTVMSWSSGEVITTGTCYCYKSGLNPMYNLVNEMGGTFTHGNELIQYSNLGDTTQIPNGTYVYTFISTTDMTDAKLYDSTGQDTIGINIKAGLNTIAFKMGDTRNSSNAIMTLNNYNNITSVGVYKYDTTIQHNVTLKSTNNILHPTQSTVSRSGISYAKYCVDGSPVVTMNASTSYIAWNRLMMNVGDTCVVTFKTTSKPGYIPVTFSGMRNNSYTLSHSYVEDNGVYTVTYKAVCYANPGKITCTVYNKSSEIVNVWNLHICMNEDSSIVDQSQYLSNWISSSTRNYVSVTLAPYRRVGIMVRCPGKESTYSCTITSSETLSSVNNTKPAFIPNGEELYIFSSFLNNSSSSVSTTLTINTTEEVEWCLYYDDVYPRAKSTVSYISDKLHTAFGVSDSITFDGTHAIKLQKIKPITLGYDVELTTVETDHIKFVIPDNVKRIYIPNMINKAYGALSTSDTTLGYGITDDGYIHVEGTGAERIGGVIAYCELTTPVETTVAKSVDLSQFDEYSMVHSTDKYIIDYNVSNSIELVGIRNEEIYNYTYNGLHYYVDTLNPRTSTLTHNILANNLSITSSFNRDTEDRIAVYNMINPIHTNSSGSYVSNYIPNYLDSVRCQMTNDCQRIKYSGVAPTIAELQEQLSSSAVDLLFVTSQTTCYENVDCQNANIYVRLIDQNDGNDSIIQVDDGEFIKETKVLLSK